MAAIKGKCPECGMAVTIPPGIAGAVKCPICGVPVPIGITAKPAPVAAIPARAATAAPAARAVPVQATAAPVVRPGAVQATAAPPVPPTITATPVFLAPPGAVPIATVPTTDAGGGNPASETRPLGMDARRVGALLFFAGLAALLFFGFVAAVVILILVLTSGKKEVASGSGSGKGSSSGAGVGGGLASNNSPNNEQGSGQGSAASGEPVAHVNRLPPELQDKVNGCIDKGKDYLYENLKARRGQAGHQGGESALMAFTLLECGVPSNDPVIQQAAEHVRKENAFSNKTYGLACAIMFLDRLGEKQDEELIKTLALRLIAGQTLGGMWTYDCQSLSKEDEGKLYDYLKDVDYDKDALQGTSKLAGSAKLAQLPQHIRGLPLIQTLEVGRNWQGGGDNSNTQFGLIGLWIAKRHGVPVQQALALVEHHFRKTQMRDGSWDYSGGMWKSSMTCAGLLGLAVGKGVREEKGSAGDDAVLNSAMRFLASKVETPRVARKIVNADAHGDLYYLWSLERVAMVYGLEKLGGKDWYRWAAECITDHQQPDGSWIDLYGGPIDTSFALLVLKRVNVAKDLTKQLNKLINIKDLESGK